MNHSLGSGSESHLCRSAGVIEFEDKERTRVKDRFLESVCTLLDEDTSSKELESNLSMISRAIGGRADFNPLLDGVRSKAMGRSRIKVALRIFNDQLARLFDSEKWRSGTPVPFFPIGGGAGNPTGELKFASMLRIALSAKDEAERMDRLVDLLSRDRLRNPYRSRFLESLSDYFVKVEVSIDALATASRPSFVFESGTKPESTARDYLNDSQPSGSDNFFSEL